MEAKNSVFKEKFEYAISIKILIFMMNFLDPGLKKLKKFSTDKNLFSVKF